MKETLEQRVERLASWRKELDELNVEELVGAEQPDPATDQAGAIRPQDEFDVAWAQHCPGLGERWIKSLDMLHYALREAFRTAIENERKTSDLLRAELKKESGRLEVKRGVCRTRHETITTLRAELDTANKKCAGWARSFGKEAEISDRRHGELKKRGVLIDQQAESIRVLFARMEQAMAILRGDS